MRQPGGRAPTADLPTPLRASLGLLPLLAVNAQIVPPTQWICFTFPINMTGQPAASVPAGWTEEGLPVGLQIVGRHLADATVLRAAAAYESARPWAHRWPPLLQELRP